MLSAIHKNQVDATVETQSEYADSRVTFPRLNTIQVRLFNAVQKHSLGFFQERKRC